MENLGSGVEAPKKKVVAPKRKVVPVKPKEESASGSPAGPSKDGSKVVPSANRKRSRPNPAKVKQDGQAADDKADVKVTPTSLTHSLGADAKSEAGAAADPAAGCDGNDVPDPAAQRFTYRGKWKGPLKTMMYGFGDAETPLESTIELMEDIVAEFLLTQAESAMAIAKQAAAGVQPRGGPRGVPSPGTGTGAGLDLGSAEPPAAINISEHHLLFLTRKDPDKYTRIKDLMAKERYIQRLKNHTHLST